jgi:Ca2+-binding EF-hand superfamily protein
VTRDEVKARVEACKAKLEALTLTWNSVPPRDKVTLVQMQLQIALLLQHQENLQGLIKDTRVGTAKSKQENADSLRRKLAQADERVWQMKAQRHEWKQMLETEQAKLVPLKQRLDTLRAQLNRFRSSKTLLRSAFDRCDTDHNGSLSVDETVSILVMLSPPDQGENGEASIREYFTRMDTNHDHAVNFDEFSRAFESLLGEAT